jgi:hypothetical protein
MSSTDHVIWDMNLVHVVPEHFLDYIKVLDHAKELMKKHGANVIATYYTQCGGHRPEILWITKYDSMAAMDKCMTDLHKDPEFAKMISHAGPMVKHMENYVCMADPAIGFHPPTHGGKSKKMMEMLKVKHGAGFSHKFKETLAFWKDKMGEKMPKPLVVLHPMFATQRNVIAMFEVPEHFDDTIMEYGKVMHDPHNWPKMNETHHHFEIVSTRLLANTDELKH